MFLLGVEFVFASYVGTRLYEKLRSHKSEKNSETLADPPPSISEAIAEESPLENDLHYLKISGLTMVLTRLTYVYPVLLPVSLVSFTYTAFPYLRSMENAVQDKKIDNHVVYGIADIITFGLGNVMTASAGTGLFYAIHFALHNKEKHSAPPDSSWVLKEGVEIEMPLNAIKQGDIVVVKTGDIIPAAGIVVKGSAVIEQPTFTTDAEPVEKILGDTVRAAAQVRSGHLYIQVKNVGGEINRRSNTRVKMLSVRVGEIICALPSEQVQHIDYVESITLLPFTHAPIEGLTHFNGQAVLQLNLATLLGTAQPQASAKRMLVNSPQGRFALRIDEVLDFANLDKNKTPLLQLNDILLPCLKSNPIATLPAENPPPLATAQTKTTVLLVASADKTLALLTHNIDHIQEMSQLQTLDRQNTQGELLIKVKDHLLPTYSLGKLLDLKATEKPESLAVIMCGEASAWALLVQQVIALEEIEEVYSSGTDVQGLWYVAQTGEIRELIDANQLVKAVNPAARLWYVTTEGQVQELVDAEHLIGKTTAPLAITISSPHKNSSVLQTTEHLTTEGLQVYCGTGRYLLPLSMATCTLKDFDQAQMSRARLPAAHRAKQIPWINASAFLFGTPNTAIDSSVLLSLSNHSQILLGVERIALSQSSTRQEKWVNLALPYPACLFFDAAYYDKPSEQWILRVLNTVRFADLPWAIKKSLAKAIVGWVDGTAFAQIKTLPD
jgi:chemotaxis signal transduction protein